MQDIDLIVQGFPINRSMESLHELFRKLAKEVGGALTVERRPGDYQHRAGLTHEPMVAMFELPEEAPVLHSWLCSLDFWEHLAYRLNARVSFPKFVKF